MHGRKNIKLSLYCWELLNAWKTRVSCTIPEACFPIAPVLSHKPYAMNTILRYFKCSINEIWFGLWTHMHGHKIKFWSIQMYIIHNCKELD